MTEGLAVLAAALELLVLLAVLAWFVLRGESRDPPGGGSGAPQEPGGRTWR